MRLVIHLGEQVALATVVSSVVFVVVVVVVVAGRKDG